MRAEGGAGIKQSVSHVLMERQEEKGVWVDSTQIRSLYFQTADSCW